jgi:hypothetical protein
MTDREMLELAAKAGGVELQWNDSGAQAFIGWYRSDFDPLNDRGDALELQCLTELTVVIGRCTVEVSKKPSDDQIDNDDLGELICIKAFVSKKQIKKAVCRAITSAAAQIGKEMK